MPPSALAAALRVGQGHLQRLEVAPPGAALPQGRAAGHVAALAPAGRGAPAPSAPALGPVLGPQRVGHPQRHLAGSGRSPAWRRTGGRAGGGPRPGGRPPPCSASCRASSDSADQRVEVDLGRQARRRARAPCTAPTAAPSDAVADGVVRLPEQRAAAALEAVDDDEQPQRPGPVEGVLVERVARSRSWRRPRRRQGRWRKW